MENFEWTIRAIKTLFGQDTYPIAFSQEVNFKTLEEEIQVKPNTPFYAWFAVGRVEDLKHYQWHDEKEKKWVPHVLSKTRDNVKIFILKEKKNQKTQKSQKKERATLILGTPLVVYKFLAPCPSDPDPRLLPTDEPLHFTKISKTKWAYKPLIPTPERQMCWSNYCPSLERDDDVLYVTGAEG